MNRNYFFKLFLVSIPISAFVLMSSSGGRNDGRTGSLGDGGASCATCHTGGASGASLAITTNIPSTGYDVNTVYDVTVALSSSTATSGFQLTAEKISDNSKIGTFITGTGSRVTGQRITHNGTNLKTWSFKWRSPSTSESLVKFYAAAVAANGNGVNDSGDKVVLATTGSIQSLGIEEAKRLNFSMHPNPSSEKEVTVQLPTEISTAKVDVYDISGKFIKSEEVSSRKDKITVKDLSRGTYIFRVAADGKLGAQQFIKE
ncbi:choice-of-anchor V domain-containing protein [Tenacibaculum maritimum]|uniref:choice-of-anchor V domain-containing protein n=1 Tax=Tenacibaculum maritimum TaxID=107401 RepID=UPI003875B815